MKRRIGAALALAGAVAACTGPLGRGRAGGEASINVADAALSAGMYGLALNVSNLILAHRPNDTAALATKGDALFASGNTVGAEVVYRSLLALDPSSVRGMIGMGRAQLHSDPQAAEAWFVRVLQHQPRNVIALNDLGIARDLQGRHDDAQLAYRQALGIDPNNQSTMTNLGLSVALSGHPQEGAAILRPLAEQPGAPARMRADLATALALGGDAAGAQKVEQGLGPDAGGSPPAAVAARSAAESSSSVASQPPNRSIGTAPAGPAAPSPVVATVVPAPPPTPAAPSPMLATIVPAQPPTPAVATIVPARPPTPPAMVTAAVPPSRMTAPIGPRVVEQSGGAGGMLRAVPSLAASAAPLAAALQNAESGCPLAAPKDANAPDALLIINWLAGAGCGASAPSADVTGAAAPASPAMLALAAMSRPTWPVPEPSMLIAGPSAVATTAPAVAPTVTRFAAVDPEATPTATMSPQGDTPPTAAMEAPAQAGGAERRNSLLPAQAGSAVAAGASALLRVPNESAPDADAARFGAASSDALAKDATLALLDRLATAPPPEALLSEVVHGAWAMPLPDRTAEPAGSQAASAAPDSRSAMPQPVALATPLNHSPTAAPAAGHPAPGAGWRPYVQVASLDSEQAALATWDQLAQRAPALLVGYKPVVVQVEIDGRSYWRLRTTGFADLDAAKDFCTQILTVGSGCWVTRGWP